MKRVLVTGSSRGIGLAIARALSFQGWNVALHASTKGEELELAARSISEGSTALYAADLADVKNCGKLMDDVLRDGPLHALVNNAGVYLQSRFIESGDREFEATFRKTFAVNFESPLRLMRVAAQHFAASGGGKMLNVASRVGFKGESGASLYAASKAALINVTRSLSVELAPKGIQVFGIAPGWVETAMAREGIRTRLEAILSDIPLGRMAKAEDCGEVAAFLLSDSATYLSGVVIDVNGASYFH